MTKLLLALLIKHAFCDLYLQNKRHSTDKSKYIGECHTHYIDHFILTFLVCYIFLIPIEYCLFFSSLDYIFHWHIDYIKTKIVKFLKVKIGSVGHWLIQTFDQISHYLTYYLIVYMVENETSFINILKTLQSFFKESFPF